MITFAVVSVSTSSPGAESLASLVMDHPFSDDEPLLLTIEEMVTAGAARSRAAAIGEALRAAGVAPGNAVAVQLPNGPEMVITMIGTWLAGAVFVPLNPRLTDSEMDKTLEVTAPAAIVRRGGIEPAQGRRVYPSGTALVLWTSGTTGAPKAIIHTHAAYLELLDRVLRPLRERAVSRSKNPSPNLIPVSLALNAGIYNVLFGLRAGAAIVIMERFETSTFAALVRRFGVRSTVLPPAAIAMLNDDEEITDLSPLRYVRSITAPLSALQARRFIDRFGVFVLNGYGQAEIGEVIGWTAADARAHPAKIGAVGRPHPGVDLKVLGDDGAVLEVGHAGVLRVRSPNMAVGYASGDRLDDRVDSDGFIDTGDVARVDEDGFVWIEGRVGDVINRGGNKVYPGDVEEVLRLSPKVLDAAVVGVPDDRLGEVPVAFYTGRPASPSDLEQLCRQHLLPYKVPISFHHVGALPRNEAGKILRSALVGRYQQQHAPTRSARS
jgi:acyl-CoA synthetase (AMP-forming)/AMP-acid ligase II